LVETLIIRPLDQFAPSVLQPRKFPIEPADQIVHLSLFGKTIN
jgi:hypothetical protein